MKKFACVMTVIAAVTLLVQPTNAKSQLRHPSSPTSPDEFIVGKDGKPVPRAKNAE
jgi:hypothetical protein